MNRKEIIKQLKEIKSVIITSKQLRKLFPTDYQYGKEILEENVEAKPEYIDDMKNYLKEYERGDWFIKITFKKVVGFALAETPDVFTKYPKEGSWFDDTWEAFTDEELENFIEFKEVNN
jgi:hypothetical protein